MVVELTKVIMKMVRHIFLFIVEQRTDIFPTIKIKMVIFLESIQATMVILIWTIKAVSKRVKVEEIIKMRNNLVRLL